MNSLQTLQKILQERLGYTFKDPSLLELACIHKSFGNERRATKSADLKDNERLEFLGDSILGLVISELLLGMYPNLNEGDLSKIRASLVNEKTLSQIAQDLQLGPFLKLGKGESQTGGDKKSSILASFLEALIAALYLDGGLQTAKLFTESIFKSFVERDLTQSDSLADYKTRLQEVSQAKFKTAPKYELIGTTGPEHEKIFEVRVSILEKNYATASGKNKKQAEQKAAAETLKILDQE